MEQFAARAGIRFAFRCWSGPLDRGPHAEAWFRSFASDFRRVRIAHDRFLSYLSPANGAAEFDGDVVGIEAIDGIDEPVIYHLGDPEACGIQFVL